MKKIIVEYAIPVEGKDEPTWEKHAEALMPEAPDFNLDDINGRIADARLGDLLRVRLADMPVANRQNLTATIDDCLARRFDGLDLTFEGIEERELKRKVRKQELELARMQQKLQEMGSLLEAYIGQPNATPPPRPIPPGTPVRAMNADGTTSVIAHVQAGSPMATGKPGKTAAEMALEIAEGAARAVGEQLERTKRAAPAPVVDPPPRPKMQVSLATWQAMSTADQMFALQSCELTITDGHVGGPLTRAPAPPPLEIDEEAFLGHAPPLPASREPLINMQVDERTEPPPILKYDQDAGHRVPGVPVLGADGTNKGEQVRAGAVANVESSGWGIGGALPRSTIVELTEDGLKERGLPTVGDTLTAPSSDIEVRRG